MTNETVGKIMKMRGKMNDFDTRIMNTLIDYK